MFSEITKIKSIYFILLLLFINILAHYLPFERISLSPDDYSRLNKPQLGFQNFIFGPSDRPLHFFLVDLQNYYVKDNPYYGFLINIVCNSFLLFIIWKFIELFYEKKEEIFFISLIFILLFNKVEIYHTPIYSINVLAAILYLLSIYFFIKGIRLNSIFLFLFSIIFYVLGIFLYEIGFFIVLIFLYLLLQNQKRNSLIFFILAVLISLFYISYRLTNSFGFSEMLNAHSFEINKIPYGIIDLIHNYIGRTSFRITIYGIYNFLFIDNYWLILILVFNLILLFIIKRLNDISAKNLKNIKTNDKFFFILLFVVFSIPPIINGMASGRHTIVPDISLSIFIFYILFIIFKKNNYLIICVTFLLLIINQGNSWTQVISCRINNAIYDYIKNLDKDKIINSDYIIFDQGSFSRNIKHTLLNNDKILERYFGAQALEDQTVVSMIAYNKNINKKNVTDKFIRVIDFKNNGFNSYNMKIIEQTEYRNFKYTNYDLTTKNLILINYSNVYNNGYRYGNR